jgi:hypothetical protein
MLFAEAVSKPFDKRETRQTPMPTSEAFPTRRASAVCKARANEKKDSPNPRRGSEAASWSWQCHWPVFDDHSRVFAGGRERRLFRQKFTSNDIIKVPPRHAFETKAGA